MNKKEISEIRRLFTPDRSPFTRICGCYVDGEKNKVMEMKEAFLSLPEEDMFKYFEIFKKTLSGSIGKNLMHLEFPLEQEAEGGAQEFLFRLKSSGLKDDTLLEAFYDRVIESYRETENYFIILVHGAYDIPRRAKDGMEMFDASEDVYEFILCSICPVKLSKPGLSYKAETNAINERIRDRVVEPPVSGFLFPAFTDRNTDLHSILYYSKNPDELKQEFSQQLFGCDPPLTAASQKETFNTLVADTLLDGCTYETVKSIHESLAQLMEERKDDPEPLTLMREDVKNLLESTGADASALEQFDTEFEQAAGDGQAPLFVSNVVNTRKFEIKTPDINISVKPDRTDLIETRILNGRPYFLIPADDSVEVNGIPVKPAHTEEYN
ncbi:MAG TPA: DUF4317 domain-containing protein [Candidatus Choladousia intestinigallinarum]|nr:DUF4317 domain-containing protein [Candidatus Choladousia intestinigallinarum]